MYKKEALITLKKLESAMQDNLLIVKEIETLRNRIMKGNCFEIGTSYGRLEFAIQTSNKDVSRDLVLLHKYLSETEKAVSELTLDDLKLGVRISNYCKRAGIYTVKDLRDTTDLKAIFHNNGDKYYQELVEKLDKLGINI